MSTSGILPVRIKRIKSASLPVTYELPASLGVFFKCCWNGQETRQHVSDNGPCPNCGRETESFRLTSLHAIRSTNPVKGPFVLALDHKITCEIFSSIQDKSFLVHPILLSIGRGGQTTISKTSEKHVSPLDAKKSAERICAVWRTYFQGNLSVHPDILSCGESWIV